MGKYTIKYTNIQPMCACSFVKLRSINKRIMGRMIALSVHLIYIYTQLMQSLYIHPVFPYLGWTKHRASNQKKMTVLHIALCRLIYPGFCLYANVFNHYHRIIKGLTLTKLSAVSAVFLSMLLHMLPLQQCSAYDCPQFLQCFQSAADWMITSEFKLM